MRPIGSFIFFMYFCGTAFAAATDVKATALPSTATVGDEIRFYVRVAAPENVPAVTPDFSLGFGPFELKKMEERPEIRRNGRVTRTFVATLVIFQVGDFTIPPIPVAGTATQPVKVKIRSVAPKLSEKDDIKPIKGPARLDTRMVRDWALAGLAAALLALLVAKQLLRRRGPAVDPESLKSPHERAHLELVRLKKKNWVEEGKNKEFYSEFSDILRRYLERRFGISVMEWTTVEALAALKEKNIATGTLPQVKDILERSDLVKFAKFAPPPSTAAVMEAELLAVLEATKPQEAEIA